MHLERYFSVGRPGTTKSGFRALLQLTWVKTVAVLCVIVALVFVGVAVLAIQDQRNASLATLQEMSNTEAFQLTQQLASEIANLEDLTKATNIQESLLRNQGKATLEAADPVALETLDALRQAHKQILSVALVNKSGAVLAISPAPPAFPAGRSGSWIWFDQALRTDHVFIEENTSADGLTGTSGIHIAVPIKQADAADEPLGVLYAIVDPTSLAFVASEDSGLRVVVYDRMGAPLIPSFDPIQNTVYDEMIPQVTWNQIAAKQSGTASHWSSFGSEYNRLYGFVTLSELKIGHTVVGQPGWVVVTQQLGAKALGETGQSGNTLRTIGIGAGIIGLSILLVVFFFSRQLIDLAHIANQIVEQDAPDLPIPIHSNDEVGILANALRRLAGRLNTQNTQLKTAIEVSRESLLFDLVALLTRIVQTMGERAGYRGVGIYVVEPNTQRARVAAAWGTLSEGLTKVGDVVIIGKSTLVGRALMKKEVQRSAGMDTAAFAWGKAKTDELVVPFLGKTHGALQVIGSKPDLFLEGDIDILRLIASQIGFLLDNRQMLAETQAAKEEAEKANRVKSQFLANMSHELRTPLNAILNFTGFVMDGDTGPVTEEQVSLLNKVYQSGEHLLNLINDILDLSKIEADMMQFLVEEVDLNQILVSTASVAKGLIKEKNIEFELQVGEHLPIIQGDKRRLRQVLLNLISNAVKFTRKGSVTLEAFSENGGAHITIRDTGTGIAPEDRALVFQAFQQGKHEYEVSGTGLGLAISKHFVEAHGGKIWFDSEVGVGTTFHVTLPILGIEKKEASAEAAG